MLKQKKLGLAITTVYFLFLAPRLVWAADHHVRSDAAGANNGTDWANAWIALPAVLVRGDTYYIADGSYGSYTFDDAETGTLPVTIKKATVSQHGTESGWLASYGDGTALFEITSGDYIWQFTTGYWEIDGMTGYFKGSSESYGIELYSQSKDAALVTDCDDCSVSNLSFQHIKMHTPSAFSYGGRAFDFTPVSNGGMVSDLTFRYLYINEVGLPFYLNTAATALSNSSDVTIEYCVMRNNYSEVGVVDENGDGRVDHSEGMSIRSVDNLTLSHNWWESIEGTAIIPNMSNPLTVSNNWSLYGNVFYDAPTRAAAADFTGTTGGIGTNQESAAVVTNVNIFNNTFYNHQEGSNPSGHYFFGESSFTSRNNLWYHNSTMFRYSQTGTPVCSHDYFNDTQKSGMDMCGVTNEQTALGNPFVAVSEGSENFHLTAATNDGYTLSSPYDQDCTPKLLHGPTASCVTRGEDGIWDRGAFEFVDGQADTTAPGSPIGLVVD